MCWQMWYKAGGEIVGCQEAIATAMANSNMHCKMEKIGQDGKVRMGEFHIGTEFDARP